MYDSSSMMVLRNLEVDRIRQINYLVEEILNEVMNSVLHSFRDEYVSVTKKEKTFNFPRTRDVKMENLDFFSEKKILCHSAVIGQESPLMITELLKTSRRLARCPPTLDIVYL